MDVQSIIENRIELLNRIDERDDLKASEVQTIVAQSGSLSDMVINSFCCGYYRGRKAARSRKQ